MAESPHPGFRPTPGRLLEHKKDTGTVRKLFPRDQMTCLEREEKALAAARGPGVPRVIGRGMCEDRNLAYLEIERVGEHDIRAEVCADGTALSDVVFDVARQTADILVRLHERRVVHGDVKPANLVRGADQKVYLIDFENAIVGNAKDTGDTQPDLDAGFSGGTHGFAPPEAYLGVPPTPAFDVFGLGATLHYMLTGWLPDFVESGFDDRLLKRLHPTLDPKFAHLIRMLLSKSADERPAASEIVATLGRCEQPDAEDLALERALLEGQEEESYSITRAELVLAKRELLPLRLHWGQRLEGILSRLPVTPSRLPADERVRRALSFCRAMRLCMRFLPRLPLARTRLQRAAQSLPELLRSVPAEAQRLRQNLKLEEARHLVRLSLDLCRNLAVLNLAGEGAPQLIESTGQSLVSALKRLDAEQRRQTTLLEQFETALSSLDLSAARKTLVRLQELFSGANRITARARDRLHRLVWLLERLVAGRAGLQEATELIATSDIDDYESLFDFVARADRALETEPDKPHRSLSLIARVLSELGEGYPSLISRAPAEELEMMRLILTKRTVTLLRRMQEKLEADPVPLRPLLKELLEVDRILMLDCLVDSSHMTRTELLDGLEQLRLRVEEISERFRRLAAGAREQVQQGRLTTALYDLERALKSDPTEDLPDDESSLDLRGEIENVRKLREEIKLATKRNLELNQVYIQLRDREGITVDEKLRCLDQREQVLTFLHEKGPRSFQARYLQDLRELRAMRLEDLAGDAEDRFLASDDAGEQVVIAGDFLDKLARDTVDSDSPEGSARVRALRNRWASYHERARADIRAEREARQARSKRRRIIRLASISGGGIVLLVLLLVLGPVLFPGWFGESLADTEVGPRIESMHSSQDARNLVGSISDPPTREVVKLLLQAFRAREALDSAPADEREKYRASLEQTLSSLESKLAKLDADNALRGPLERKLAVLRKATK